MTTPASPSHRFGDLLRVHREPRVPLDGDEALGAVMGEQLLGIALQPFEQALHLMAALVCVLARALRTEDDDQPPALVLPFADPAILRSFQRDVGVGLKDLLLQRDRQIAQPRTDDILAADLVHGVEVGGTQHTSHAHRALHLVAALHVLQDRAVPLVGGTGEDLVANRQSLARHHQGQQDLRVPVLAVFAETVLAKLVLNRGLEVERGAIEEEYRHRQQRPARLPHAPAQMVDHRRVELVHHPVDLLKGKADAEVFLEPAHAAPLAVGVGDACHHHVEERVVRSPVARARQQPIQAQLAVHLAVDLVDARDQALLLFKLLEIDRKLAVPLASDADYLVRDRIGCEQRRLVLVLQLRLDVLAEPPQALKLVLIHGHTDVADDALADLAAVTHAFDELDRAARAIGGGLDAYEHGGSIAWAGPPPTKYIH